MTLIEKLKLLTDKDNGPGVPMTVIARFAHCHISSISHYVTDRAQISEKMDILLKKGLKELKQQIDEIIGEE